MLLDIKQLAQKLHYSVATINNNLSKSPDFPKPYRLTATNKGRRFWKEEEINTWLEQHLVQD